ncbi:4643_t:CDS:2 [Funneliformis geosporum]|nr:4643_t:CDS:2 [Funneliformis geosporum]
MLSQKQTTSQAEWKKTMVLRTAYFEFITGYASSRTHTVASSAWSSEIEMNTWLNSFSKNWNDRGTKKVIIGRYLRTISIDRSIFPKLYFPWTCQHSPGLTPGALGWI